MRKCCAVLFVGLAALLSGAKQPEREGCHIGSAHNCHCPRMVAREQSKQAYIDGMAACFPKLPKPGNSPAAKASQVAYAQCLKEHGVRTECEIVENIEVGHKEDACKNACKKDHCQCHDGPACTHFTYDYDRANSAEAVEEQ